MRIFHRYLGFFLSGIMAVYAISGIVMIFRETEFLKSEREIERQLAVDLPDAEVGSTLRIKEFKVERTDGSLIYFREGTYDKKTGLAKYKAKQLPYVLDKMTKLHKATTNAKYKPFRNSSVLGINIQNADNTKNSNDIPKKIFRMLQRSF